MAAAKLCPALWGHPVRSGPPSPAGYLSAPGGDTTGSSCGDAASQGSGLVLARAPTLPEEPSLEGLGPRAGSSLTEQNVGLAVHACPKHKMMGSLCVPPPHKAVGSKDMILIINGVLLHPKILTVGV